MLDTTENKQFAEESRKTKRMREKLRKQLQQMDRDVTPQALKRKLLEIHRWIACHASHRVVLKSKAISLFDENQNTADLSQKLFQIAHQLKALK